jgi:hypothetical protein
MAETQSHISYQPLRTPKAAAFAGIGFAVLEITSVAILQTTIPADSLLSPGWLAAGAPKITLALGLLPFAGIAFLWFMGVLRDRLGHLEDQFFSTLFFGSGLLYLAMTFATATIAGGLISVYAFDQELLFSSGLLVFGAAVVFKFNNVYAVRMAGMFMMVLGTIWVRTGLMPRWLALLTYGVALILIVGVSLSPWARIVFPIWVLLISIVILVLTFRHSREQDGVTLIASH